MAKKQFDIYYKGKRIDRILASHKDGARALLVKSIEIIEVPEEKEAEGNVTGE